MNRWFHHNGGHPKPEIEPPLSPLLGVELEHYHWLIGGLLDGARRMIAVRRNADAPTVRLALDEARELFDELIARIPTTEGRDP